MPWIYAVVGLLVGIIVGIIISRLTTPQYKNQKLLQKDLQSAKFTLEQQRQEITDHFAQTAEMLDTIGKDYTKLYQHLAKTSAELVPTLTENDNPFLKNIAKHSDSKEVAEENPEQQPKDYASGSSGLLRGEKKEILHSAEAIEEKSN
jgi:uncharacterized membrane-anchored protein YhcB (DUF1043 family)